MTNETTTTKLTNQADLPSMLSRMGSKGPAEPAKELPEVLQPILGSGAPNCRRTAQNTPSVEYRTWCSVKQRCLNPKRPEYSSYGGRGIKICEKWMLDFESFLKDVGVRPSSKHSIDRYPNKDGDYRPGNVRWATREEQNNNKRTNQLFEWRGETKTIAQWAKVAGMSTSTMHYRLRIRNWSMDEAMNIPLNLSNRSIRAALAKKSKITLDSI